MPAKSKSNLKGIAERDCFQTPRYATKLLIPYIPKHVKKIWECAAGDGRIARVLLDSGYAVEATDLKKGVNFLEQNDSFSTDAEITNPPFSLKEEFFRKCVALDNPFALLIPFDMTGWLCEAFDKWGCQGLVPTRRINYITPNTLRRIHNGEIWRNFYKDFLDNKRFKTYQEFSKEYPQAWEHMLSVHANDYNYTKVDDAPQELLHKYSSSDFHSFWLTRKFNLPNQLTFVELTNKEIKNNI